MRAKLFINNGGNLSACVPVKLDQQESQNGKNLWKDLLSI